MSKFLHIRVLSSGKINKTYGAHRPGRLIFNLWICFFFCVSAFSLSAQEYSWPGFHGPDRTNKSAETGLLKAWPAEGPVLNWSVSGLGNGYSSVSVSNGFIFTAGSDDELAYVYCFDLSGNLVWKKPNGKAWSTTASHARTYTGARSTPTFDNGILYHLGESGRLAAFDAFTGKEIWYKDLPVEFQAAPTDYGYSESVLTDGENLYVSPFGKKGFMVCLEKSTGDLVWANTEVSGIEGYSSPVMMEYGGIRQVIGSNGYFYYGVDAGTGRLLWKIDFVNQRELNNTDAIVHENYVFVSSGYGKGSKLTELEYTEKGIVPKTVWESELMDNHHGGVILHEGYLYGAGSNSRGWFCLDFLTGKQMWKTSGKGSLTFADGMLYLLDERGTMKLVSAQPDAYRQTGEFNVPEGGKSMYWAHPVVCNGVLYVRHADQLFVYKVKEE